MNLDTAINACLNAGYRKVFTEDGDVIALFQGDEHAPELVVRKWKCGAEAFRAWVMVGPSGMKTPKHITVCKNGRATPVRFFKSIEQAAKLALENPHF